MSKLEDENIAEIAALKDILPLQCPTLRNRREYDSWKENKLQPRYSVEYAWLEQFGRGGKECFYDLVDDMLPWDFKLTQRQILREGWSYAGEFAIVLMELIRKHKFYETKLILQQGKGGANNIVLVRPVLGEIIGKGIIITGIQK